MWWARAIMEGFLEELQPGQVEKIQTEGRYWRAGVADTDPCLASSCPVSSPTFEPHLIALPTIYRAMLWLCIQRSYFQKMA